MSITVEHKGIEYRVSSPPALEKPKVIKRILPVLKSIGPPLLRVVKATKEDNASLEDIRGDVAKIISIIGEDKILGMLESAVNELSGLSDDDLSVIFRVMLSNTKRKQGAHYADVLPNGVQAFSDMDIDAFIVLTAKAIEEYIITPLQGLLLDSQEEPKQALAM